MGDGLWVVGSVGWKISWLFACWLCVGCVLVRMAGWLDGWSVGFGLVWCGGWGFWVCGFVGLWWCCVGVVVVLWWCFGGVVVALWWCCRLVVLVVQMT